MERLSVRAAGGGLARGDGATSFFHAHKQIAAHRRVNED